MAQANTQADGAKAYGRLVTPAEVTTGLQKDERFLAVIFLT